MFEILTSDPAILLFSSLGLVATAVSIMRDARTRRARTGRRKKLSTLVERREKIAA
ncbi:MAG TPA: hypothetical protein VGK15_08315 [Candidatus Limnocylindria bacterium]|jgi:hypothetical protein